MNLKGSRNKFLSQGHVRQKDMLKLGTWQNIEGTSTSSLSTKQAHVKHKLVLDREGKLRTYI